MLSAEISRISELAYCSPLGIGEATGFRPDERYFASLVLP